MTGGVEDGGREGAVPAWPSCGKQEKEAIDPKAMLLMRNVENQSQEECAKVGPFLGPYPPIPHPYQAEVEETKARWMPTKCARRYA